MNINKIVVSAGRTFNHPYESYSNLRPHVQLTATLDETDDAEKCVKDLQAKVEMMVEDHKKTLLDSLHKLEEMQRREREITKLESLIRISQQSLQNLRDNPIEEPLLLGQVETRPVEYCDDCGARENVCECVKDSNVIRY